MKTVLLGLTTTPKSDWREKVEEIKKYDIKEIALFPTFLEIEDRKELYKLLEETGLERIPHVHLRDDMEKWELDYLVEKYDTKLFNIHANGDDQGRFINSIYAKNIYIENQAVVSDAFRKIVNNFSGLCIDFSHWEDQGVMLKNEGYDTFEDFVKTQKIGCCHISGVNNVHELCIDYFTKKETPHYSKHTITDLKEVSYMKKYVKYLPEYISIELENTFKKQLEVKKYLESIINK